MRRRPLRPSPPKPGKEFRHHVYVILLDAKAARHRSVLRVNPKRDASKPCVYVGMSGLSPEHRLENHKHGYKAAWVVEKYGVRLTLDPMPDDAALRMDLRREGFTGDGRLLKRPLILRFTALASRLSASLACHEGVRIRNRTAAVSRVDEWPYSP